MGIWKLMVPAPGAVVTLHPVAGTFGFVMFAVAHTWSLLLRCPFPVQYSDARETSAEALSASDHLNHAATSRLGVGIHSPLRMTPGMKRSLALSWARTSPEAWSVAVIPIIGALD